MEVPAPQPGTVKELRVKLGDKVSEGSVIVTMEAAAGASAPAKAAEPAKPQPAATPASTGKAMPAPSPAAIQAAAPAPPAPSAPAAAAPSPASAPASAVERIGSVPAHASPGVRSFARELGVDLGQVKGSGPKARILKEDIQGFVKSALAPGQGLAGAGCGGARGGGLTDLGLPAWPKVDFAKFGPVEAKPLSRIQKISGPALARNWVMIPHVTQFDEADITELEAFRAKVNEENAKAGIKVTPLAFLVKAVVAALKKFPQFNSSLDGENLVIKHYWHIGFAADTPNGLVVPVIKD